LERAYDDPHVAMILREVFEMSQDLVENKETKFSPDKPSVPNSIKRNREEEKYSGDGESSNGFTKMNAMIRNHYQFLSSVFS